MGTKVEKQARGERCMRVCAYKLSHHHKHFIICFVCQRNGEQSGETARGKKGPEQRNAQEGKGGAEQRSAREKEVAKNEDMD
jgi:hypothetical protein